MGRKAYHVELLWIATDHVQGALADGLDRGDGVEATALPDIGLDAIGPGAALRGDWGQIIIEDGCNVQENCTIHMFPGVTVVLHQGAHIGHGAVIHGAAIGKNCLVGMNAVIMDNVVLGDECIVGALSFIKADEVFEARSLIVGNPAKKIKAEL